MLLAFNRGYSTVPSVSSYILRDIHARMNFSKRGHVLCISCTLLRTLVPHSSAETRSYFAFIF